MASSKVSALTASDALTGAELFYADGLASAVAADVKVTAAQIKTFCSASPTLVTPALGVATATSIAIGGATIGTNALAITGTASFGTNNNGFDSTGNIRLPLAGNAATYIIGGQVVVASTGQFAIASGASAAGTSDAILARDAADTWAQRRGTNPQKKNIYGTFSSTSSFERFSVDCGQTTANVIRLMAEKGGSGGTARIIAIDGFAKGSAPANTDLPSGSWAMIFDGTNAKLVYNNGGTLQSVTLS